MTAQLLNEVDLVHKLQQRVKEAYVFPDVAEEICRRLQSHLESGDYADMPDGETLALALTYHLQEVNHDEHLWVRYHQESLPEDDGALRMNSEWQEEQRLEAGLDNFGFHKVERLPGNIGYLDIRYFHQPAWGGETATAAMTFLARTDALIIDLRKCPSGYPGMVALVATYLFDEDPVHLSSIYWRDDDFTRQYWTLPYAPGRRYGDKPIYVLTSRGTFSAGEEFAAILQARKKATVIGDKTDGGFHPGTSYRLDPHFELFIPIGRAFSPLTGKDLEGIGVIPDIAVPQEQAFQAAYHRALHQVIADLAGAGSGPHGALLKEAQTALKELEAGQKICQKCGYTNPVYRSRCKNCDEPLNEVG
ncbi:MAG TPA: S41 family peptidase [Anaerolineaceae bacterium]|nr:S41 family peptidase [Anaerolineaceae bacterium]HPN51003.1 S41 family peptidase [Anaerolineaceae bacterium]